MKHVRHATGAEPFGTTRTGEASLRRHFEAVTLAVQMFDRFLHGGRHMVTIHGVAFKLARVMNVRAVTAKVGQSE